MSDIAKQLREIRELRLRVEEPDGLLMIEAADEIDRLRAALETIADIGEGSGTVNSMPHMARIARTALDIQRREET